MCNQTAQSGKKVALTAFILYNMNVGHEAMKWKVVGTPGPFALAGSPRKFPWRMSIKKWAKEGK